MPALDRTADEAFARLIAGGMNGVEAVRLTRPRVRARKQVAYDLLRRPAIRTRIQELREVLLEEYPVGRLLARYERLADLAEVQGDLDGAAAALDRIARILLPPEGPRRLGRRPADDGEDAAPPAIAELIKRLDEREQAEREGRLIELRPATGDDAAG